MRSMILEISPDALTALTIVAGIVLGALVVVSIVSAIWKWVLIARYSKYNKQQASAGLTGSQTAIELLKGLGLSDVEVVKCNFFSAIFLGNSYSPFKKRIRLRKNIFDSTSLTAVALAAQKVALAQRDKEGDKKIKTRSVFMTMGYFAPFAVVPLVILGLIVDLVSIQGIGLWTIVFSAIAVAFYVSSFIVLILNIPIEKRACKTAVEFMEKTNLLSSPEIEDAKVLYKTYITNYVLDFIDQLLYIIWRILRLALKLSKKRR